jgi:hypothetical protein
LTVTRVLYGQDRDGGNSSLFTSCDHASVWMGISSENFKIDVSFQVDSTLHGFVVCGLSFLMGTALG